MAAAACDLALARALRYLERCGVEPSAELREELEGMIAERAAVADDGPAIEEVMDLLWSRLQRCRGKVPPAAPPIHRASMGHG